MKNVSSLKPNSKIDSPKTPGGISKSLLTPCRRIGLSRNWRKTGPSPFVSPLAGSAEVRRDEKNEEPTKRDTRKRKKPCEDDEEKVKMSLTPISQETALDSNEIDTITVEVNKSHDIETTPLRNVSIPRRKKSKILTSHIVANEGSIDIESSKITSPSDANVIEKDKNKNNDYNEQCSNKIDVDTPVRTKSKSKVKPTVIDIQSPKIVETKENISSNVNNTHIKNKDDKKVVKSPVQKSPENLTKECIVVIQKKIYKKDLEKLKEKAIKEIDVQKKAANPVSQALFDSDSDDVPLSTLNKEVKSKPKLDTYNEDDDFAENTKVKVKKLEDKTTSVSGLRSDNNKKKTKPKKETPLTKTKPKTVETKVDFKPSSQSSVDDDEDFVMDKRTILIRKTYEKVSKLQKAKSTGSITQKDIDELKAKIEVKKKLLLAKAVTEDTVELRDLIKKWQKGCQDALMELMELMKNKFPDKQNMDYSEMLQTLKIPASLVGYDEENDCFGTPTDEGIILSKFNDT